MKESDETGIMGTGGGNGWRRAAKQELWGREEETGGG